MILRNNNRFTCFGGRFVLAVWMLTALATGLPRQAVAQVSSADTNAAAIASLQTFELPDKTASIRLPASWQVFATGVAFIQARGPNGELAIFGAMIPVQDASATGDSSAALSQSDAADPAAKFLASLNWIRASEGNPPLQARLLRETPLQNAPAAFGKCFNMVGILNGMTAMETDFCSLPEDAAGNYRNFFKAVGLPLQNATQERSLMEAILASYRMNLSAIQGEHKAIGTAPPMQPSAGSVSSAMSAENSLMAGSLAMAEANLINHETISGEIGSDVTADDFDHGVLRGDTPVYEEGDDDPIAWIGD